MKITNLILPALTISAASLLFFGCERSGAPTNTLQLSENEQHSESSLLNCENVTYEIDGKEYVDSKIYHINKINEYLSTNPELKDALGYSQVETCEQATEFIEQLKDFPLNNYVETKDFEIEPGTEINEEEPSRDGPLLTKVSNNTSMLDTDGSKLKLSRGVVRIEIETSEGIGSCTGVMLNSNNIATSAHCVDNAITHTNNSITVSDNMITGLVKATIYYVGDGSNRMLTQEFQYLKAGYRSSYLGAGHVSQDIGIIKRTWGSWTGTTSSDWRRFNYYSNSQLTGTTLETYGAGVHLRTGELDGNLRSGNKPVTWNSYYGAFSTYGGTGGTFCRGDSGGPGLTFSGLYGRSGVVATLQSWSTASDGACTAEGSAEYNTPTAGNHDFILEFIAGTGCNSYRTTSVFNVILGRPVTNYYKRCW